VPGPTMTTTGSLTEDLGATIRGRVIGPASDDYDAARAVTFGGFDKRPAAIARVADAGDVAKVIAFARERGLPLSVRSGGHGATAQAVVDDGIVIDLRDMKAIDLDVERKTVWAETGLTAAELSQAVGKHGLAIGFGDTGSVGIGGITLGGGVGYLARKFGLTVDSLAAADIVTAEGELLRVDAERHPDLFWAIRGGGGNFGVATRFKFRLADVSAFTGGMLVLPATADAVARFVAESEAAPEAVTTIGNVMPCPPLPFVPEALHGTLVIFAIIGVAAPDDEAAAMLAPFRAIAEPIADMVKPIPYPEIYPPEDDSYHPLAVSRNLFVERIDLADSKRMLEALQATDSPMRAVQIRVLGGAVARVANDATAYAHRDRKIMVNVAIFYEGAEDKPRREAWVEEVAGWLAAGDQAAYVNFIGFEGDARTRAAYPHGAWDRLVAIKARYDPTNLFDGNQNIPPAA